MDTAATDWIKKTIGYRISDWKKKLVKFIERVSLSAKVVSSK
jgi:hypothetical protein